MDKEFMQISIGLDMLGFWWLQVDHYCTSVHCHLLQTFLPSVRLPAGHIAVDAKPIMAVGLTMATVVGQGSGCFKMPCSSA